MTLARQFLGLQLLIVLVVLVFVAVISIAQSAAEFRRVEGRQALSAAENLAANPLVRQNLLEARPRNGAALPALAESVRAQSNATGIQLVRADRLVVTSSDPSLLGSRLPLGVSGVLEGRSWTGVVERDGRRFVAAHAPVLSAEPDRVGELVGFVVVERAYPSLGALLERAAPNLVIYLGVASALGVAGSLLLSRRVKRQTLGLEPDEIVGLVEHREAMLHGLKEGVIALDPAGRLTLVNDSARDLLGLPVDCIGQSLEELGLDPQLRRVLTESTGPDRLVLVGDRVLAFNRMPMRSRGQVIGSVTTLRDRTELSSLERELGTTRATSETLRAQTHEFANQLHTISGLLHLQEYDEVMRFVDGVSKDRASLYDAVTSRVEDPTVAALLIAKASLAAERDVDLVLVPDSQVGRIDDDLSRDLTTVVGNLVDNAIDAVTGRPQPRVEVCLREDGDTVTVTVADNGPGVPAADTESVFTQGWTTKSGSAEGGRGFGLALTRLVCRRRGGDVSVRNDGGAVFTAVVPTGRLVP
jgi:sensor histidine kinase regulating citrate/malate metabolism